MAALRMLRGKGDQDGEDRALVAAWVALERAAASGERAMQSLDWWQDKVHPHRLAEYRDALPENEIEAFDDMAAEKGMAYAAWSREAPRSRERERPIGPLTPGAADIGHAFLCRHRSATRRAT